MSLNISRILHAGYVFECDEIQIAFDPIFENPFSRNCHAFPDVRFDFEQIKDLQFTAVFISHYHDDHCSLESLDFLDRSTPIYIYCIFEELFSLIRALGFTRVYSLKIDVSVTVGPFEVIPRRALDVDVDSMFHIRVAGLNVLNVVDSWIDYSTVRELARTASWDMVLWPFQTMREIDVLAPSRAPEVSIEVPIEWIEQLKILNPRFIVPSSCQFVQESWSWYNHAMFPITYKQFERQVQEALPDSRVVRLNPSVSVALDKNSLQPSSSLMWVQPVGDQDVDYEYKPFLKPCSTAEISKKFPVLTSSQAESVYEYCRSGLIEKYKLLEPSAETYFRKPRFWRLSIYDHHGAVQHFYYKLNNENIELASENEETLSWTTEVPIFKLYAALECGESLTSMYVRINDLIFSAEVEKEIQSVDVVEDPLVRCLFTGVFGAYQATQLKRLLALK